jgi:hypothetical protein
MVGWVFIVTFLGAFIIMALLDDSNQRYLRVLLPSVCMTASMWIVVITAIRILSSESGIQPLTFNITYLMCAGGIFGLIFGGYSSFAYESNSQKSHI